ncbi:hypothetical protein Tco_0083950 [Tanacetum coccineum]
MVEYDEEKTGFHTEERVYCFTYMPKRLKNSTETLQRMVEKVLVDKKERNIEVYLEEIVEKSKDEQRLMEEVEETLNKLKWVNMKINPNESTFRMKEGRFLGYTITKDGIRPNPTKIQAVMKSHTPRGPDQIRHLSLQLASIGRREKCRYSAYTKRVRQSTLCYSWKEGEFKYPSLIREAGREGSDVGMILLGPNEEIYSYAIRLNFDVPDHNIDYKALLAGLVASAGKGMKYLHVFIDSKVLVDQVLDHASSHKTKLQSRSANRACNHKVGTLQLRSIGGNQNKAIRRTDKRWQRGKSNKQGTNEKAKLQLGN